MVRSLALLLLMLSVGSAVQAQNPVLPRVSAVDAGLDATALEETTVLLREYVARRRISGAVAAVARDGKVGYLESVGVQDFNTRTPMDERTLFRIYSMTKPVTAVAAMMLWEEGVWQLDDPVERYLPEFAQMQVEGEDGALRAPSRPITIRDLLLHTSGLNHRSSDEYQAAAVRDRSQTLTRFIQNITAVPLKSDPGTRYRYSASPTVVGRLIEVWSGQTLEEFFRQRIFGPLGMVDTSFWVEPGARGRLAEIYGPDANGRLQPVILEERDFTEPPILLEGAVGLVSTAPDFLRFAQMLLNGGRLGDVRLLEESTVEMMTRNGLSAEITETRGGGRTGWGLGNVSVVLKPDEVGEPSNAGEYGWNGSAGTLFWIDPSEKLVGILMTQSSPYFPDELRPRFKSSIHRSILVR